MLDSVCFINLITESEKDGIHNLSQLGLGRMIFDPVDGLSSDEAGPEGEAKPPPQTRRRRIRRRKEQKEDDRSFQKLVQDPNVLSTKLSKPCGCKQKTCANQFLAEPKFQEDRDYLAHWLSLAKLDQDQIAACLQHGTLFVSTCSSGIGLP